MRKLGSQVLRQGETVLETSHHGCLRRLYKLITMWDVAEKILTNEMVSWENADYSHTPSSAKWTKRECQGDARCMEHNASRGLVTNRSNKALDMAATSSLPGTPEILGSRRNKAGGPRERGERSGWLMKLLVPTVETDRRLGHTKWNEYPARPYSYSYKRGATNDDC
jgi:hypothetical protein